MSKISRRCAALLLAFCGLFPLSIPARAEMPGIASFFQNAAFSGARLSPNGHFVAIRAANLDSRATLGVIDLSDMSVKPVASFSDADIDNFQWVNNERLVFNLTDLRVAAADVRSAPGLFAVNRDGSRFRQLVKRNEYFVKSSTADEGLLPWNTFLLKPTARQNSDEVLVVQPESYGNGAVDYIRLYRLDTVTRRLTAIDAPLHSTKWIVDGDGAPRVAVTMESHFKGIHYNDPETHAWRKLAQFDAFTGNRLDPLYFSPDGKLYVKGRRDSDNSAAFLYDLAGNKLGQPVVSVAPGYDFEGEFIENDTRLLGVRYMIDAEVTQWFDKKMQDVQKTVDAMLPNTINRISIAPRPETPFVVVTAFSDRQPELYLLYNTETRKFAKLGSAHGDIDAKQMSSKDMVHYKARDGLDIPAYLTLPKSAGKKNLPLVVLVHGGPFVRGATWDWDPEVQFLASRGYAVLQPEFRGSTGFGWEHFHAGWKQWGLGMQNDIADGAKWAIAQGIADPKRICIGGASYGGYATLMGLANDPDLFRCGFEWVGVTDINLMYTVSWSDASGVWKQYGMPALIGDQVKDAAQLKATSPLENAARIRQPLLLAYGGADMRVPLVHGEKFYDAVTKTNKDVEWVVYSEEGHGWATLKNRVDFWSRVEKFLDRNIGKQ